jgi:hypothetical protein
MFFAGLVVAGQSPPALAAAGKPCLQIRQACLKAGFVQRNAKQGNGLIADCIVPIIQGTAQPANASKPLPTVDPQVVSACHSADPNFGSIKSAAAKSAAPAAGAPAQSGTPAAPDSGAPPAGGGAAAPADNGAASPPDNSAAPPADNGAAPANNGQ